MFGTRMDEHQRDTYDVADIGVCVQDGALALQLQLQAPATIPSTVTETSMPATLQPNRLHVPELLPQARAVPPADTTEGAQATELEVWQRLCRNNSGVFVMTSDEDGGWPPQDDCSAAVCMQLMIEFIDARRARLTAAADLTAEAIKAKSRTSSLEEPGVASDVEPPPRPPRAP